MMVAIDASRAASLQKTGVGWYCYALVRHLQPVIPSDVRVLLYSDCPLPEDVHPLPAHWKEQVLAWPPVRQQSVAQRLSPIRWPMWSQIRLAERVLRDRPQVLFIPAHVIPYIFSLTPRRTRPHIVTTIHDVVFRGFPETYSPRERWYADRATRLALRHADHVIVPTQHVADELERWYGAPRERIVVVPHGVSRIRDTRDAPRFDGTQAQSILYVGRLEHKKNVVRMVEAFSRVAVNRHDLRLVLAGSDGYGAEAVREAIVRSPVRDRVETPGWVDARMYAALRARAMMFLFPTLAEGFGLPILEAMAAGLPVITSRGGAHEEVAGDAALFVDPMDVAAIAAAIERLLDDLSLRTTLIERGNVRAAQFTWQRTAQQTWEAIRGDTTSAVPH